MFITCCSNLSWKSLEQISYHFQSLYYQFQCKFRTRPGLFEVRIIVACQNLAKKKLPYKTLQLVLFSTVVTNHNSEDHNCSLSIHQVLPEKPNFKIESYIFFKISELLFNFIQRCYRNSKRLGNTDVVKWLNEQARRLLKEPLLIPQTYTFSVL